LLSINVYGSNVGTFSTVKFQLKIITFYRVVHLESDDNFYRVLIHAFHLRCDLLLNYKREIWARYILRFLWYLNTCVITNGSLKSALNLGLPCSLTRNYLSIIITWEIIYHTLPEIIYRREFILIYWWK